jgi:CheY-like chemotaxis protein
MNGIIGFSDLALKMEDLPAPARDHIRKANQSAKGLLAILNDILDFSKIEAGKLELEVICFNLFNLVGDAARTLGLQADQKGLDIRIAYSEALSYCYKGDPTRLRQIFLNLLSNSIKFTEEGGITVSVEPVEETLLFRVKDTGIGIPEEKLSHIFESFTQADGSTTRHFGGTGLGTTICRQLVEAMGGRIWIESELGKGTSVFFTLPLSGEACRDGCDISETIKENVELSPRLFRILLAEDNLLNGELILLNLEKYQGHSVTWVKDGSQAVDRVLEQEDDFDLVLMDFQMPVMDGLKATETIRSRGHRIPVVALTASVTLEDQSKFKTVGMDGFVKKPIDFKELISTMESVVPESGGQQNTALWDQGKGHESEQLSPLKGIADVAAALRSWRTPKAYASALRRFIKDHGRDACIMKDYLKEGDHDRAGKLAHQLKGMSLGFTGLSETAAEIETQLKDSPESGLGELIRALECVLDEIIVAVNKIKMPEAETARESYDARKVEQLLKDLLNALARDNPDPSEPVLNRLSTMLPAGQLLPIQESLENFDFRKAEAETLRLRSELDV